ncbi:MAG: DNA polymerase IV [Lachnospiraceae bacterium]|nr:DNA polymerase IV [Lachnospiraceae bacterium]
MSRVVFHADVNSAFLSWSAVHALKENPDSVDLRTIPSAVGGDVSTRHGIITAKSIPAKKYGIVTAMPVMRALELCPSLVLVQSDYQMYREYSQAFIKILKSHAKVVEQVSIDEAFMDMTGLEGDPRVIARQIADEVKTRLGFTINVGISCNKLLAKMASDFEKPDKVHTLFPNEIAEKMWPLPIGDLFGCGSKTAEKLIRVGIRTIGEASHTDPHFLRGLLGDAAGTYIYQAANGKSDSPVSDEARDVKSVSNEYTTTEDITEKNWKTDGLKMLDYLTTKVSGRLAKQGLYAETIGVSVKTDDFKRHSIQTKCPDPVQSKEEIYPFARRLFEEILCGKDGMFQEGKSVRLIAVVASSLSDGSYKQMTLLEALNQAKNDAEKKEKKEKLDRMTALIKNKFGESAIRKGSEGDDL